MAEEVIDDLVGNEPAGKIARSCSFIFGFSRTRIEDVSCRWDKGRLKTSNTFNSSPNTAEIVED